MNAAAYLPPLGANASLTIKPLMFPLLLSLMVECSGVAVAKRTHNVRSEDLAAVAAFGQKFFCEILCFACQSAAARGLLRANCTSGIRRTVQ